MHAHRSYFEDSYLQDEMLRGALSEFIGLILKPAMNCLHFYTMSDIKVEVDYIKVY